MDTLSTKPELRDGQILVNWQWWQGTTKTPHVGQIAVRLDSAHQSDQLAIAELAAMYHLLEERAVHGVGRLGNGLRIQTASGAISKALRKGALKATGKGETVKAHIAAAADFLTTKYFEAEVEVAPWREAEPKSFTESAIDVGPRLPRATLECTVLGGPVGVSRHAMARYIARIDRRLSRYEEEDLTAVPNGRWTAAWRWFERVLKGKSLETAQVRPEATRKLQAKYGSTAKYLRFPDARAILVCRADHGDMVVATVLRDDAYSGFIEKDAYMVGQRIVRGHIHELKKAMRNE